MNQGKHADIPAKEPQVNLFFDKGEDKGLFGVTQIGANHRKRHMHQGPPSIAGNHGPDAATRLQDSCIANLKVVERALWVNLNCTYNFDTAAQPQTHVVQASTATAQEPEHGQCPNVDDVTKSSEPNRYDPPGACRPALSSSGQARAKHLPRSQASDITRMTRKKCGALTMK
ncbi:uncharacterized protein B0T23DRAFT_401352 [Neurospora hispaniola]|uniref:Uncharacterized protein n=1 Tax=Neurospora hispaniola TaxID=588809 RepID=A0AAJ0IGA8_9PEZI|nr:hypothetical protein B0T23DRAFT_401352 [Neurospora hispaniola]